MATSVLMPVSEYLKMSSEYDMEYADGYIEDRNVGEREHSDLQHRLIMLLSQERCAPWFDCRQELRVQTDVKHFRVPDVCLLRAGAPYESIVKTPPLLAIEILSPEDRLSRTLVRVREFLAMGVAEVWIFDPEVRTVQVCVPSAMTERRDGELHVPGTPISIVIEEVFSVLNRAQTPTQGI